MATDDLARSFAELTDESRLEEARQTRAAKRWNSVMAAESSTLAGLLSDLYATSSVVRLNVANGRTHTGVPVEVGQDFVAVASVGKNRVMVALRTVSSLQVNEPIGRIGTVSDYEPSGPFLAEVITHLAAARMRVNVLTQANEQMVSGILSNVGADMLTIELDAPAGTAFIPLNQLSEISVS